MKIFACQATLAVALLLVGSHARAQSRCTCPDILDLVNRLAEAEAAISAYEAVLTGWEASGNAPLGTETNRQALQARIQADVNQVSNPKANRNNSDTDFLCEVHNYATTECLKEVTEQHEFVHLAACRAYQSKASLWSRFTMSGLAPYAREEIASYRSELAYVKANLSNLERECRLELELQSTITGTIELAQAEAKTKVDLAMSVPEEFAPKAFTGSSSLKYVTKDTGPPKIVGGGLLARLVTPCYTTFEGKGDVVFGIKDGWIMRETVPPYAPLIELTMSVGKSSEIQKMKGPRGCPQSSNPGSFWSHKFLSTKKANGPDEFLLDGWTMQPRAGVFAEKIITSTCGVVPAPGGILAGLGVMGFCSETTTLTLKLK